MHIQNHGILPGPVETGREPQPALNLQPLSLDKKLLHARGRMLLQVLPVDVSYLLAGCRHQIQVMKLPWRCRECRQYDRRLGASLYAQAGALPTASTRRPGPPSRRGHFYQISLTLGVAQE